MKRYPPTQAFVPSHSAQVWLLLMAATILAWCLVEAHSISAHIASTAAVVVAGFKVRLVFLHFMELKTAPLVWRMAFEAWLLFFLGIILLGYWL